MSEHEAAQDHEPEDFEVSLSESPRASPHRRPPSEPDDREPVLAPTPEPHPREHRPRERAQPTHTAPASDALRSELQTALRALLQRHGTVRAAYEHARSCRLAGAPAAAGGGISILAVSQLLGELGFEGLSQDLVRPSGGTRGTVGVDTLASALITIQDFRGMLDPDGREEAMIEDILRCESLCRARASSGGGSTPRRHSAATSEGSTAERAYQDMRRKKDTLAEKLRQANRKNRELTETVKQRNRELADARRSQPTERRTHSVSSGPRSGRVPSAAMPRLRTSSSDRLRRDTSSQGGTSTPPVRHEPQDLRTATSVESADEAHLVMTCRATTEPDSSDAYSSLRRYPTPPDLCIAELRQENAALRVRMAALETRRSASPSIASPQRQEQPVQVHPAQPQAAATAELEQEIKRLEKLKTTAESRAVAAELARDEATQELEVLRPAAAQLVPLKTQVAELVEKNNTWAALVERLKAENFGIMQAWEDSMREVRVKQNELDEIRGHEAEEAEQSLRRLQKRAEEEVHQLRLEADSLREDVRRRTVEVAQANEEQQLTDKRCKSISSSLDASREEAQRLRDECELLSERMASRETDLVAHREVEEERRRALEGDWAAREQALLLERDEAIAGRELQLRRFKQIKARYMRKRKHQEETVAVAESLREEVIQLRAQCEVLQQMGERAASQPPKIRALDAGTLASPALNMRDAARSPTCSPGVWKDGVYVDGASARTEQDAGSVVRGVTTSAIGDNASRTFTESWRQFPAAPAAAGVKPGWKASPVAPSIPTSGWSSPQNYKTPSALGYTVSDSVEHPAPPQPLAQTPAESRRSESSSRPRNSGGHPPRIKYFSRVPLPIRAAPPFCSTVRPDPPRVHILDNGPTPGCPINRDGTPTPSTFRDVPPPTTQAFFVDPSGAPVVHSSMRTSPPRHRAPGPTGPPKVSAAGPRRSRSAPGRDSASPGAASPTSTATPVLRHPPLQRRAVAQTAASPRTDVTTPMRGLADTPRSCAYPVAAEASHQQQQADELGAAADTDAVAPEPEPPTGDAAAPTPDGPQPSAAPQPTEGTPGGEEPLVAESPQDERHQWSIPDADSPAREVSDAASEAEASDGEDPTPQPSPHPPPPAPAQPEPPGARQAAGGAQPDRAPSGDGCLLYADTPDTAPAGDPDPASRQRSSSLGTSSRGPPQKPDSCASTDSVGGQRRRTSSSMQAQVPAPAAAKPSLASPALPTTPAHAALSASSPQLGSAQSQGFAGTPKAATKAAPRRSARGSGAVRSRSGSPPQQLPIPEAAVSPLNPSALSDIDEHDRTQAQGAEGPSSRRRRAPSPDRSPQRAKQRTTLSRLSGRQPTDPDFSDDESHTFRSAPDTGFEHEDEEDDYEAGSDESHDFFECSDHRSDLRSRRSSAATNTLGETPRRSTSVPRARAGGARQRSSSSLPSDSRGAT
eukprot:TRINITY_DN9067_c0_g1_i1.p1 TRINITY_DN9067_c0_g1~~TRINITY_DN9067_c0_g1_i1.p1  ORF type:complete len:1440 (+),score=282.13 TRINITY_DN9067_c0_g1_i1:48-4367(+)